jgi:hypothetical protein
MSGAPLTPEQRRLRAQIANDARWSRLSHAERAAQTQAARDALFAKYCRQVDPDGQLPQAEREALAAQARRADLLRAALKSSRSRTRRAAQ